MPGSASAGPAKRYKEGDRRGPNAARIPEAMQDTSHSFGYWLRRRRKALDLTQEALGRRVSCSNFTIRKIEADERRPSRQLAERLAAALTIPPEERRAFLDAARGVHAASRLAIPGAPLAGAPREAPAMPVEPAARAAPETTPFVGRGREYELLVGCIARLAECDGRTVLIEGEPGIGKSRLMRELARHAESQGVPTLATNCYEIERAMPYQPVIDLVTRALDRAPPAALHRIAPVSLAELAALVPDVAERFQGLPELSRDFPEARQARLSRAVGQLLEATGDGRPLVFMVDDIQWADDASAQVLHYLARHVAGRPALALFAYRDEDVGGNDRFARLVESLRRDAGAQRLPLSRLGRTDAEHLVAALGDPQLPSAGLAERLYRETEGNPFFLVSILQALRDGEIAPGERPGGEPGMLPDALRAAVRGRLAHVPQQSRPTLETAAVLGRRFDFDALQEATHEPEARLLAALETLVSRRLLREERDGGWYDFSHDKVREVVYRDIGGARRRLLHRSVADALERRADDASHERDARLAEHYERAHDWSKALKYLVLAGERSQALFAMRDALHWLDRAVALAESHPEAADEEARLALYERRGAARAQAGQTEGAVADMRRVIDAARSAGDREKARDLLIRLGMAYRRADAYDDATACLNAALAESRRMNDEHQAADTLYHLGTVAWSTGKNDQSIAFHQEAVEICERSGLADLVAVQAFHGRGEAHFANAEPAAAIRCYTRSIELARGIGDKSYESENLMMIGHALLGTKGLGDYPAAMTNLQAALDIARTADLQWHMGPTLLGLDHARACTGRYGEAWTGMQKTMHWLESLKQVRYQFIAYDFMGQLMLDLGLHEQAIESMERALELSRNSGILFWCAAIDTHRAVARSRMGGKDAAAALEIALDRTRRTSERYLMVRCLDGLAEISLAAGDTGRCRAYADELLGLSAANGLRELEASARRWRGESLLAEKAYPEAQIELSRAAALAEEVGRVRLGMDTQAALGRVASAQGQRESARGYDQKARVIAESIEKSAASSGIATCLRRPEA
jgi:tetratricopeptide (TPR) repeat protein/transcriptional regulator with XRE-family HTH domain